jgi:transcriptional regulator with XRE-family HTH domain
MEDFATLLIARRKEAGLSQTQLAQAAALTPSYVSFLESRKKPPPSDGVCRRLAAALGIGENRLLEAAHLERTPPTIRKRVAAIERRLQRERRTWEGFLDSLLSPIGDLRADPASALASVPAAGDRARKDRLRETLAALGRRYADRERELRRLLDVLPPSARGRLLEALPRILRGAAGELEEPSEVPVFPLLFAPLDRSKAKGSYFLEAAEENLGGTVRKGDRLLVDPSLAPRSGDLLVLRGEAGALFRRLESSGGIHRLEGGPGGAESLDAAGLAARLAATFAGVVVEIRRRLRGAAEAR